MKSINKEHDLFVLENDEDTLYIGKAINLYPFMLEELEKHIKEFGAEDGNYYLESMLAIISALIREKNKTPNKQLVLALDLDNDWTLHEVNFTQIL